MFECCILRTSTRCIRRDRVRRDARRVRLLLGKVETVRSVINSSGIGYSGSEGAGLEGDGKGGSVLLGGVMMVKSSGSVFCEELGWRWSGDCEDGPSALLEDEDEAGA